MNSAISHVDILASYSHPFSTSIISLLRYRHFVNFTPRHLAHIQANCNTLFPYTLTFITLFMLQADYAEELRMANAH